jgi:hypothetical protein
MAVDNFCSHSTRVASGLHSLLSIIALALNLDPILHERSSVSISLSQDLKKGLDQYLEVEPKAPVINIP